MVDAATATDMQDCDQAEQRIEPRWVLKSSVSVFLKETKECIGLLVNCSENGLMISTYQPLDVGQELDLDIVDIHPDMDGRRTGECHIEVRWSRPLNPSMFANGCRIVTASDEYTTMFKGYVEAAQSS